MKRTIASWVAAGLLAAVTAAGAFACAPSVSAAEAPNDPHYDKQRYLEQTGVPAAWEAIQTGGRTLQEVTVAVVDTGVDLKHPDLAGRLVQGTNILQSKQAPQDDNGHGTAVAGVIAAVSGNGQGIAGIAPNARIMPIKAVGAKGVGEEEHLGQGIRYAVDQGADIVVLSLGLHLYSPYLAEIVAYAESKGVVLVAATGNDGKTVRYPAAYPTVVAVGGASLTNEYKTLSNFGPEVDLIAPWFVFTTGSGGTYVYKEGTSMAAPQVAGAVALLLGLEPDLTPGDVRERLRQSALPLDTGWNARTGYGLLRTDAALATSPKPDMHEPNDRKEQAKPTSVVTVVRAEFASRQDVDWFAFDPPYQGEVSVRVKGWDGKPLPAELVLDQGGGAAKTFDLSGGKEARLPSPDGERLYAMLRPTSGSAATPYRIETDFYIYSDPYEPNDKAYQAYRLPTKATNVVEGTFSKIDDQDWYSMKFDSPGTLSLRLETDSWRIDPELYVVRDGEPSGKTYDDNEEGEPEFSGDIDVKPGTYYFRVKNVKALFPLPVAGEYTLTAEFEKKFFDDFEPNDRSYQATTMTPDRTYRGVFDSSKDEDWFQIRVSRKSLVTIEIGDIPLDRYMYYTLFTSGTQQKYGRTSPFGTTSMKLTHELEAGVYYIRLMTDAAYQDKQYSVAFRRAPLVAGFADIDGHWARDSVKELVDKGIVKGYDDYRFDPNGTLTRAEAAAFIARAYNLKPNASARTFPDVPRSHWAKDAVASASAKGVIQGYPDGNFRPNDPVTRAEMTVMAALASGKSGKATTASPFTDVAPDHWAAPYIHAFVDGGQLNGFKDGTFRPNGRATRAEFATLLANLLK
ncbi:MAG TPA: S8 family serine peptidase [Paenibacillus sp.]|nr:S8 family serine peptidase [Paenibacillus sp.]